MKINHLRPLIRYLSLCKKEMPYSNMDDIFVVKYMFLGNT